MAKRKPPRIMRILGPGLITGAADDDPSGVSTYSTAGAAFGYGFLWTAPLALPLMISIQLMCARIGMVSGRGLAGVLRNYYPRWTLWLCCGLLLVANTVNIGADLGAMAAVMEMLTGVSTAAWVPAFAGIILGLLVFKTYPVIARVFKWLTLILFAYVITAFFAHPNWADVLRSTFIPRVQADRKWIATFVAIFGTTISPYLFFWQAAEEVEEEIAHGRATVAQRQGASPGAVRNATLDVIIGMAISTLIFYFIVVTTGATLHVAGQHEIQTAQDAAAALEPLAGSAATVLFSLGIIGTGMLGVSVLAGSSALAVAEAFNWRAGMSERLRRARAFYTIMIGSVAAGATIIPFVASPMKLLFFAAMLNGLLAPPLIIAVLLICNNRKIMGEWTNGKLLNVLGVITALVMAAAAVALLVLL